MIPTRLTEAFESSLVAFFSDACGVQATASAIAGIEVKSAEGIVATIGFTGAQAKGALVIATSTAALKSTHPMTAMGADVVTSDLFDWGGEIANQTLGRLKNLMLPYGVTLGLAIPTVVLGAQLSLADKPHEDCVLRVVRTATGQVFGFSLSVVFAQSFDASVIDTLQAAVQETKKEGDGFLF